MNNLIGSKMKFPSTKNISKPLGHAYSGVHDSILDFVGNTPLIKLQKIPKDYGLTCNIYAKCEYMNPSGSIKDRIAKSMMDDAEAAGCIHKDSVFLEPTSGNTGIAIAFRATLKDHKSIIISQNKNSDEKMNTIRLLGAELIQISDTDPEVPLARKLKDEHKDKYVFLNQFTNDVNPRTHYNTTGVEITSELTQVDMVSMGAGTGGTLTGVAYRVKKENPTCIVVAADPYGSKFFGEEGKYKPFLVEGIGGPRTDITCDTTIVDDLQIVTDKDAFLMARELVKKEGLLCGGSSGVAMVAAIQAIKKYNLGAGKCVVVVLPDGIRNYMSKFVSDQWMEAHLFMNPPQHTMTWWNRNVTDLTLKSKYQIFPDDMKCGEAVKSMGEQKLAVIVNKKSWFMGCISKDSLRHYATNPTKLPGRNSEDFDFNEPVSKRLVKDCFTLALNGKKGLPKIGLLSRILDITPFVVLGNQEKEGDQDYFQATAVANGEDILDYIFKYGN